MKKKPKIPITRVNKFFDESDFNYFYEIGREYVEDVLDFRIILLKIDRTKTQADNIYNETKKNQVVVQSPIEIKVMDFLIEKPQQKAYNNEGNFRYIDYGNLTFSVYVDHLKELNTDIQNGDVIGYADREDNIKYWRVEDDGRNNSDNAHTIMGYKGYYRSIKCVVLDPSEYDGM